jgi:uncharacterized DUF497 family protein
MFSQNVSVQDRIEDGESRWMTLGLADDLVLLAVAHQRDSAA